MDRYQNRLIFKAFYRDNRITLLLLI
jgi:hypothetical protein